MCTYMCMRACVCVCKWKREETNESAVAEQDRKLDKYEK
jgi:hypothetical protein